MNSRFIPCKITNRIWAEKLLSGEVFMRPLYKFGSWDASAEIDDQCRRDVLEGAVATYANPYAVPFMQGFNADFLQNVGNVTLIDQSDLQYFKVFCMYCLEIEENSIVLPDTRVSGFGDTVVVFRDFNTFLIRLWKRIVARYENSVDLLDRVNYYRLDENRALNPLFEKASTYEYQKELRMAFCQSEKNLYSRCQDPNDEYRIICSRDEVVIDIGSIEDIAYAVPIKKFLDGSGVIGQHYFPQTGNDSAPYDYLVAITRDEMASYHATVVSPVITIF